MLKIPAFCLDWHISHSAAFHELLVSPLKPYADVQLIPWDGINSDGVAGYGYRTDTPIVFCQFAPSLEMLSDPTKPVVWIPMWDNQNQYSIDFWRSLPKHVRIVAFSDPVAQIARSCELQCLQLRYFKNPNDFPAAQWTAGRTLMYWNRTGIVSPVFLKRLCAALDIKRLLFRAEIDPRISPEAAFRLPERLGNTQVQHVQSFGARDEYLRSLQQANIFLAPRQKEGVGLSFLEAMASGCAVLAYDEHTMNEYIDHKRTGYLLKAHAETSLNNILFTLNTYRTYPRRIAHRMFPGQVKPVSSLKRLITPFQNWDEIAHLDLRQFGQSAREQHQIGYVRWRQSITEYAQFVLN